MSNLAEMLCSGFFMRWDIYLAKEKGVDTDKMGDTGLEPVASRV